VRSGRLEKRIQRAIPVEISALQHPPLIERASTENVSPLGVRLLTKQPMERDARLIIRSLVGDQKTVARVVYCQRLADGRFGVGMQFLGASVNWSKEWIGTANR